MWLSVKCVAFKNVNKEIISQAPKLSRGKAAAGKKKALIIKVFLLDNVYTVLD